MNSTSSLGLTLSRREFLAAGGALVFGFSLGTVSDLFAQPPKEAPKLPGSLASTPMLDAWIRCESWARNALSCVDQFIYELTASALV